MCCAAALLALLGPRAVIVFWWLADPIRWNVVYSGQFLLPVLGFAFLPWTTLTYTLVWNLSGLEGWAWVFVGLSALLDVATYGGGAFGNRDKVQGYYQ